MWKIKIPKMKLVLAIIPLIIQVSSDSLCSLSQDKFIESIIDVGEVKYIKTNDQKYWVYSLGLNIVRDNSVNENYIFLNGLFYLSNLY